VAIGISSVSSLLENGTVEFAPQRHREKMDFTMPVKHGSFLI
jgi:hypothetical protein